MTAENFLRNNKFDVFTFGVPPVCIDLMIKVKGLTFEESYNQAEIHHIENIELRVIHINHLLQAKKASNRPKDQDDIQQLTKE